MTKSGHGDRDASAQPALFVASTNHLRTMDEIGIGIQKEVGGMMRLSLVHAQYLS